ncbi:signal peptidase I [Nocardioides pelophilus]|uniref:signal peptidase I n=1 Tax=Nocardioides pelophilus TaxID=2172019 RepID=UPI001600A44F|nr:signal peptidase I [Nocardioides pelophilus]
MTSHRRRKPFRPGRILLSLGAALGVVCLVAATASVFLDIRPMVVSSGSMSPAIPAGSLAFAQDTAADNVEVGDVVAVSRADGTRVMHRVVAAEPSGGEVALTLQGDANAAPDSEIYVVDRVLAVRFDVPWLGYPVSWLSTTWGLMILGAGAFGLLVFALRPSREPTAGRRRVAAFLAVPVALALVSATAAPSSAFFTDTGTVTSGSMGTHTVVSQAQPTCTDVNGILVLGNIARLTWTHVDARYEYYWELRTTGGTPVATGTIGGGQAAGSTVTLDISTGLIGTNANYNVVVLARLRTPTTWIAATTTTTPVRRTSIIIIGAAMRCGHA